MRKKRLVKKQPVPFSSGQYSKVLERAIAVFGNQKLAEEWLGRPCRYFNGESPLAIITDPVGLKAIEAYLQRIEHGVYQ
ncbi:hypothetical protein AO729_17925 [Pseudomonas sp. TTU2014-066ASC]|nr:hypothetical protein AO729_17925 [Pseudomonas sp. TTU2014-066ASC]